MYVQVWYVQIWNENKYVWFMYLLGIKCMTLALLVPYTIIF